MPLRAVLRGEVAQAGFTEILTFGLVRTKAMILPPRISGKL
jgi:hypothetical protein